MPKTIRNKTLCSLAALFVTLFGRVEAAKRPNIVYFMADDLGYGDVKCFGEDRCLIETPNFDRLASEGMKFTNAHAVAAVCVPSRMAIMTGRYPWRFAPPEPGGPWGYLGLRLPIDTFSLGDLMKTAGYTTGYVGKWHLGTRMATRDGKVQGPTNVDFSQPLDVGPGDYGFDYSFILPGSLDMYPYVFIRDHKFVGEVNKQRGWSAFNRVGPAEESFEDYNVLQTFTEEFEGFIERQAESAREGNPFFLYVGLTAPHTPTSPHPDWRGKSDLGLYGDFVMEVDDCLGKLVSALNKHGLAEDTLVIATSDHGAASYAGNIPKATFAQYRSMQALGHYSSGPFRGFKFSIYEGGRRVPFIVKWPGQAPGGTECDELIGLQDVFATFAEASGSASGFDHGMDSLSLVPLLHESNTSAVRKTMIQSSVRSWAIRDGDWKLCLCPGSGCDGTYGNLPRREDAYRKALEVFGRKPTRAELLRAPFVQLFNLAADPGEVDNLAEHYPERVQAMVDILDQEIARSQPETAANPGASGTRLNYLSGVPRFILE